MDDKYHLLDDKYSIKEISALNEFMELRTIWNNLAEKQGSYMPFLTFEWFKLWLEHFLKDSRLLILLLYKENEIVTIAPFLIKQEKFRGINIKKLDLIGNIYSPIRYFVFRDGDDKEKQRSLCFIFKFIRAHYKDLSLLDLYPIPDENNCFNVLKLALEQIRFGYSDCSCFGDWYSDEIECSGEEYFYKLPKRITKDISYNQRRLHRMGKYEFRLIRNGDIDRYMDLYYDVYSRSWQERESIGPNFHRDLAKMATRHDWLRLGLLFFNNVAIASQFWLVCDRTAFIMKTVYDQEYKKYSPGKILTAEMMKYVIDVDKIKMVDYLHGDESYKEDWAPKRRERRGIVAYNNDVKGQYLQILNEKILPIIDKNKYLKKTKDIVTNRLLKGS